MRAGMHGRTAHQSIAGINLKVGDIPPFGNGPSPQAISEQGYQYPPTCVTISSRQETCNMVHHAACACSMQRLDQLSELQVPVAAFPTTDVYSELQLRRGVRPPGGSLAGSKPRTPEQGRAPKYHDECKPGRICYFVFKLRARRQPPVSGDRQRGRARGSAGRGPCCWLKRGSGQRSSRLAPWVEVRGALPDAAVAGKPPQRQCPTRLTAKCWGRGGHAPTRTAGLLLTGRLG
jgi:hypothetical protein